MWAFIRFKKLFSKVKEVFDSICFLPPYSPQFTPVKLFSIILKEKLKINMLSTEEVKLKSKVLAKIIQKEKTISNSSVIWHFSAVMKEIKQAIT